MHFVSELYDLLLLVESRRRIPIGRYYLYRVRFIQHFMIFYTWSLTTYGHHRYTGLCRSRACQLACMRFCVRDQLNIWDDRHQSPLQQQQNASWTSSCGRNIVFWTTLNSQCHIWSFNLQCINSMAMLFRGYAAVHTQYAAYWLYCPEFGNVVCWA